MEQTRITIARLQEMKQQGQPITMLTAYDTALARLLDQVGIDIVFVSDALGSVGLGYQSVLPVTVAEMVHHTRAVSRGVERALVLAAMPYLSYTELGTALTHAGRLLKEGDANAVELEGGQEIALTVENLVQAGIPVMGHVGITRQSLALTGRYKVKGRNAPEAKRIIEDAQALEEAGVFALTLECVPEPVAQLITQQVQVPTIGIGSGRFCDGQGLVSQDLLGLVEGWIPKFAARYADLAGTIREALTRYREDVEAARFPTPDHTFSIKEAEWEKLQKELEGC